MKKKNLKKYFKKKIESGWRDYLSLNIPYTLLGLNSNDFMKMEDIEKYLDLKFSGEDTGIADSYEMLDYNQMYNNQPLNINLGFKWSFTREDMSIEELLEKYEMSDALYIMKGDKFYYIECLCGYKNPKCIWDEEKCEFSEDEPYWLYEDDKEHYMYRSYYSGPDKDVEELLQKFANNKEFESNLFSGNFCFSLVSGNFGQSINNEIFTDFSKLSSLCKTTYETFYKNYIEVTFAIRYREDVDLFLSELKKLIVKNKINASIL